MSIRFCKDDARLNGARSSVSDKESRWTSSVLPMFCTREGVCVPVKVVLAASWDVRTCVVATPLVLVAVVVPLKSLLVLVCVLLFSSDVSSSKTKHLFSFCFAE